MPSQAIELLVDILMRSLQTVAYLLGALTLIAILFPGSFQHG